MLAWCFFLYAFFTMKSVYRISLLALIIGLGLVLLFNLWRPVALNFGQLSNLALPKSSAGQFAFAVIGDNEGENPFYADLIRQISQNQDIKFLLHVGDATASGTSEEFQALKKANAELGLKIPVYFVPGNHDLTTDQTGQIWQKEIGPLWQSMDIENTHLVLLDNSNRKIGFEDAELSWLENDLTDYANNKTDNSLLIIAYHRPFNYPLASILGDDETKTSRASNEKFLKILEKFPPDQIFTGHIHSYADYAMPLAKDTEGKTLKSAPVTITGGGGQPPQSALGGLLKPKYHFLKVTVKGKKITTEIVLAKTE